MLIHNPELSERRQEVATVNNLVAADYDKPALQFFPRTAGRLVELAGLQAGNNVLDVGTGLATFAAAMKVGRQGTVIGVDIGPEILAQAQHKLDRSVNPLISFFCGDMESLKYPDECFDAVLSISTLFLLPDVWAGLKEWQQMLKPGGCVAVSGYGGAAFRPLADLFEARILTYGTKLPHRHPFSWQRWTEPEHYLSLFHHTGLTNIEVFSEQLGYYLKDAEAWWDIVWNSGFRGPVSQLAPEQLKQFKAEHLAEVSKLAIPKGIWLDVSTIFAIGHKPG